MKRFAETLGLLAVIAFAPVANAADVAMKGADILAALKGGRVEAQGWSQTFDDGGATDYVRDGRHQAGRWDVRGDQYCSVWPPSENWACYDMTIDAADPKNEIVTFIGSGGSKSAGRLIRKAK